MDVVSFVTWLVGKGFTLSKEGFCLEKTLDDKGTLKVSFIDGKSCEVSRWFPNGIDQEKKNYQTIQKAKEFIVMHMLISHDLSYTPGDWQFTPDMGEFGRLDVTYDVHGHEEYTGLRYFFFPGSKDNHDLVEWEDKDGYHYPMKLEDEPIRKEFMQLVMEDMVARLNAKKS